MRKRLRKISGRWRLRFGFCPLCDSSPPRPECAVCQGNYQYGQDLTDENRRQWWDRYVTLVEGGLV